MRYARAMGGLLSIGLWVPWLSGADRAAEAFLVRGRADLRTHRPERRRGDRPRGVPAVLRLCAAAARQARGSEPGVRSTRRRSRTAWCRGRNTCRRPSVKSRPQAAALNPAPAPVPAPAPAPAARAPRWSTGRSRRSSSPSSRRRSARCWSSSCYKCHSATAEKVKGGLRARHARRHPQGRRHWAGGRAGRPRGEPADPGGPLQGRRPQDAAEDRSCPTR